MPIIASCCAELRMAWKNGLENVSGKMTFAYAGSGIAMETLIDSTVRVTIRHSDNDPIASEAATASVSRDEATGAERP